MLVEESNRRLEEVLPRKHAVSQKSGPDVMIELERGRGSLDVESRSVTCEWIVGQMVKSWWGLVVFRTYTDYDVLSLTPSLRTRKRRAFQTLPMLSALVAPR